MKSLMKQLNSLNQNKGATYVVVLMTFVLLSVILVGMITIFESNYAQAVAQENMIKAHYLSESATDICFAALLQEGAGGSTDTLLYIEYSVVLNPNIADTEVLTDTISFEDGDVEVTIRAIEIEGDRWIEIVSTATVEGTNIKKTTIMQFQVENPMVQLRS